MLSEKLNTAVYGAKRSAIREFSRMARETSGCLALTLGEPDFDTPESVRAEAKSALDSGETHYIENNGSMDLRGRIARFEREQNGFDCSARQVIVTAGATEALFVSLFGILNPGDEVIVPTPAFVLYEEIIKLCRGVFVPLDTSKNGFQIDEAALRSKITPRTKAIVLNTPNNPTGCVYTAESLESVRGAVSGRDIFVICDDVYRQLSYTGKCPSFADFGAYEQTLLVQSFSKPWAMTGWRVGYLIGPEPVIERLELIHQFAVVSTPAPFQRACIRALDCDVSPMLKTYARRREYVLARLEELGMDVTRPDGAFYVFPSIKKYGLDSADFCRRMITEAGLAATPGFCFGAEGFIRLSYCCSDEVLCEGLDRLGRFINSLK